VWGEPEGEPAGGEQQKGSLRQTSITKVNDRLPKTRIGEEEVGGKPIHRGEVL